MKTRSAKLLAIVLALGLATVPLHAGLVVKLTDSLDQLIPGESQVPGHENEIDAISVTYGASQPQLKTAEGAAGAAGKAQLSNLTITKTADKASPSLFLACALGKPLRYAAITIQRPVGTFEDFFVIELGGVFVAGFTNSADADGVPTEEITLTYTQIRITYKPTGQTAKFGSFDVKKNKAEWSVIGHP